MFDILNGLNCYYINPKTGKKVNNGQKLFTKEEVVKSGLNIFNLIRYLRGCTQLLPLASFFNSNYKIDLYDAYIMTFFTFKEKLIGNVRWVKTDKYKKPKEVELLQKYYFVNYNVSEDYLDKIENEKLEEIKYYYKDKK